jgi:hypothetical protein
MGGFSRPAANEGSSLALADFQVQINYESIAAFISSRPTLRAMAAL